MPVSVPDLLAEPALRLRALNSHCHDADRRIAWVSTTELPDPLPFLRGDELVMTTGMLERDEPQWARLIERLAELPVAALCFGTGLVHQEVPPVVVEAADRAGLALVGSPVEVPFAQISRWVADRIFAERYDAVRSAATLQDRLVRELLSGGGLRGLLRQLHRQAGAGPVAVVEPGGRVLARHPASSTWPEDEAAGTDGRAPQAAGASVPITVDGVPVAELRTQRPTRRPDILSFASSILGLEVARHQAVLTGRRELLGQLLEDVLHRTVSDGDARRRLVAYGLAVEGQHAVVVARVGGDPARLRSLPWTLQPLLERAGDRLPTALIEDTVMVVVPDGVDAEGAARTVADHLRVVDPQVRVGVAEPRRGVTGLRLGYFEARQAARTGPGVHRAAPLSIAGLLLGNLDLPLRELGHSVLAPLLRHDEAHRAALVPTLRAYLAHDCSPGATAAELTLHRNSLRYRLGLIEQLTGRDLDRLADRMELWLALAALEADPDGAPADPE
ncbi:PucR family transcriptional regulator [Streptomyces cavernicola]|uniref:PucR family transcriptional regulator ligand-binding domain-containing protein n=1 Tax=Streptomyces cavernicola TaxID=3043613 RepID=A0ABT6S2Y4_9ACTN|nr:PucR family transcriptional regulator ligand-binding domain-containing protein [Streptomyces sp. B-S-A6]MDI3402390.1 PucR family transcriptional regulator ligand-binding domain-containing protein [Streptomyces sp. B-S-A6]